MRIEFEKRVEGLPPWAPAALSVGAVVLAFLVGGLIFKLIGGEPICLQVPDTLEFDDGV